MHKRKVFLLSVLLILVLAVIGCGEKPASKDVTQIKKQAEFKKETEPTQEELNKKLKENAVKADFVELNSYPDKNKDKKVYVEGEVGVVFGDGVGQKFDMSAKEGNGYGYYTITNLCGMYDVKEGDVLKAYGVFSGHDEKTSIPKITATIIEKIPENAGD